MLKQFQSNPPPAQVKAIEEICVTCRGAHPYYQCLSAGGNTFPEYRDNIQGYVSAAAGNLNQGNPGYLPQGVANQMRPPGSGTLPGNTIANPKGEHKAITTRSGLVTEGPTVPNPPKSVNPEEDECVEETYMDPDHAEYTIKVPPPPPVQTPKPPIQRTVILKKLPEKLRDPGRFLIPCRFSELKCKALADLGASINLMPLSVWKKLGLPDLIPTRMTLELANCAICTPDGIARDVFVPVGKFTFLADFVVVDYESNPRVLLILGRPFLRTARALINVHGEEMILCDEDESTTFLANSLLEEFADELALISYPSDYDDNRRCDIESDLREIEFLLYQGEDSDFKDSIDQSDLTHCDDLFVDPTLDMEKIKEAELLIDQLDLPCDILSEYDSFNSQDFSRDDVLPSPDNEDKVFNPGILSHEKSILIITRFTQEKKLAVSFASLLLEDFDPPFYELLVFKEVPNSIRLLPFLSENEEKVFKPWIYISKKFHCCFLFELSHPVKENPKKDQIRPKPDKNRKRDEAGKSQKQLL
nr:reverse transcriptase domain-containing protein [Tanacetum cinerariifolium]